jgi:peptidoglycan/LPS O-acetylase OafA/YrhL
MTRAAAEGNGPIPTGQVKRHYFGPDILRLVAACLVVLFHLSETGQIKPSWPVPVSDAPLGWLQPYAWMGWVGVQIFFVLSGFLIAASAVNSTPLGFLRKRAIRIFPALWISCLISLAVRAWWGEPLADLLPAFIKSAVLSPKGPYIDGVVWTLVVEAAFYAVVCAAIRLSNRSGRIDRSLVGTALLLGFASTAFTVARHLLAGNETATSVMSSFAFDVLLLRQGMFFAIGMLLFHLIDHAPTKAVFAALAVFAGAACLQIADVVADSGNPVVPVLIWALSSLLIFTSVRYSARITSKGWLKLSRDLGLMTYPLYLNHFVLSQALMPLMAIWLPGQTLGPALFALLLLNAWLIAHYPEKWLQGWLGKLRFDYAKRSEKHAIDKAPTTITS